MATHLVVSCQPKQLPRHNACSRFPVRISKSCHMAKISLMHLLAVAHVRYCIRYAYHLQCTITYKNINYYAQQFSVFEGLQTCNVDILHFFGVVCLIYIQHICYGDQAMQMHGIQAIESTLSNCLLQSLSQSNWAFIISAYLFHFFIVYCLQQRGWGTPPSLFIVAFA